MRKELEDYLFSFRQDDLKHVEKMKAILSPAEWEDMKSRLLDSKSMQYQVYPLLQQEGLYDQLVDRIEVHTDIHALERYENPLKKHFHNAACAFTKLIYIKLWIGLPTEKHIGLSSKH